MSPDGKQQGNPPQPSRPKDKGDWGERVAMEYLAAKGYAIRDTKWRGHGFEIDLVAQKGGRIVFVEVKARTGAAADPAAAVDSNKRTRMVRAADLYLRSLPDPFDYQFDIISIKGSERSYEVEHIPDAFFPSPRGNMLFRKK